MTHSFATNALSLFALSTVFIVSQSHGSTHYTSGKDLNCSLEVWADAGNGDSFESGVSTAGSLGNTTSSALDLKGSLTSGLSVDFKPTANNFFSTSDDENGGKADSLRVLPIIPKLHLDANVSFENGVLTTTLTAGGQTQTKSFHTNWNVRGTPYSIAAENSLTLKMKTPFKNNDSVLVTLKLLPRRREIKRKF